MKESCIIQVGPKCSHQYLYKEERKGDQTQTEGGNRRVEAEIGGTEPQGKGYWQLLEAERGKGQILPPEPPEEAQHCLHLDSSPGKLILDF